MKRRAFLGQAVVSTLGVLALQRIPGFMRPAHRLLAVFPQIFDWHSSAVSETISCHLPQSMTQSEFALHEQKMSNVPYLAAVIDDMTKRGEMSGSHFEFHGTSATWTYQFRDVVSYLKWFRVSESRRAHSHSEYMGGVFKHSRHARYFDA